jgi:hypothetical protein
MNLRQSYCVLVLFVLLAGCSAATEKSKFTRNVVDGIVTLDEKPLPSGTISFEPSQGATTGTAGRAAIKDGKFSLPKDSGLAAGTYRVFITSPQSDGPAPKSAEDAMNNPPPPAKETLPAKYNVQSTLKAEILSDEQTSLDFDLKSSE